MALNITRKYCTLGGCIGLARARWLTEGITVAMLHAILGGCMIVIGNGLDLGNGVSSGSFYKCQGRPQCYDLDLGWL